jgi:hypothetical protein
VSVRLNEAALHFLLEDEAGPVGIDLRRRAQNIAVIYRQNVMNIVPAFGEHGGDVDFAIEDSDDGLRAVIGINPGDSESSRMADYLAAKVEREPEKAANAVAEGNHP